MAVELSFRFRLIRVIREGEFIQKSDQMWRYGDQRTQSPGPFFLCSAAARALVGVEWIDLNSR